MLTITAEPLDILAVRAAVLDGACGGVVLFEGIVRADDDGSRRVVALEYEAHLAMAIAEFERIAGDVQARFPGARIAMAHRIGRVHVGEPAVIVAVAAAHRDEAFLGCRYAIDELKMHAQIWKKEHFSDGSADWRANDIAGRGW